jgi:protease I
MALASKRVGILLEKQYEELELWYPYYRLQEAKCTVSLIGPDEHTTYLSKHGYPAKSEVAAKDVHSNDFDALLIPGGFCPDYIRRSEAMLRLVREMHECEKILAAICHGPWVLCSTKALKGRQATGFYAIKDDMVNAGAQWVDAEVVVDGHVITSRKPADLPAFTVAIMDALRNAD